MISKHYGSANIIAGVATAPSAHGALVAEEIGLPFIYVRSAKKEHGKQNRVEGAYNSGQSVIVLEDLISSGKSSLEAVKALRKEGLNVKGLISIFTYGFDTAAKNFKKANCEFISLCNYSTLLQSGPLNSNSSYNVFCSWHNYPCIGSYKVIVSGSNSCPDQEFTFAVDTACGDCRQCVTMQTS